MKKLIKNIFRITLLTILIISCEDKFELPTTSGLGNISGDTVYVQINPAWEGFNNPQDIYIGNEPFIYVADTDNDRIVMMNLAGTILGTKSIKRPVAIAQDYQLNLIVCSEFDTLGTTFGAVYKINLVASNHNLSEAPVQRLLPRPNVPSDLKTGIRYTGVAVFYDNSFYIARTGLNNSSIFDPDNSILVFQKKVSDDGSKKDTLIGRLPSIEPVGTGLLTAYNISSLTSFKRRNTDFVMTLTGNTTFKTQWLYYNFASETPGYESKLSPGNNQMMTANKFSRPEGVTVDNSGNIYVADAEKDSIYKFNSFGDELQSFGGPQLFNQPYAVAHFDKTLYVVDKGNSRILRFILSTDLR
uniref:NHL repeat protein n=1 Tax=Ignavibacterium album TaxID=591197 RepID=A0A7V2ZJY5_9BACT